MWRELRPARKTNCPSKATTVRSLCSRYQTVEWRWVSSLVEVEIISKSSAFSATHSHQPIRNTSHSKMEIDDEDDFYAPEEPDVSQPVAAAAPAPAPAPAAEQHHDEDLEEGEEEDEGAEMDEDDSVCRPTPMLLCSWE